MFLMIMLLIRYDAMYYDKFENRCAMNMNLQDSEKNVSYLKSVYQNHPRIKFHYISESAC